LNTYTATFLISILKKEIGTILYNDQISSTSILNLSLTLPAIKCDDKTYKPDFKYMQNFMQEIEKSIDEDLTNLHIGLNLV
ncbi:hypothetical protein, partial [Campylobacter upsaliensis]